MRSNIRSLFTGLFANVLILLGFVHRAKTRCLRGEYILSLYFHKPSQKEFEKCIKWLKKHKFIFLSTDDIYNIIHNKLPFPKGAVVLTADDGWQSNEINIVAIAEKYHVPVTIFISTEPAENGEAYWWSYVEEGNKLKITNLSVNQLKLVPNEKRTALVKKIQSKISIPREAMTIKQIQDIANSPWITIGGHTLSHPILVNCSTEQVCEELLLSRRKLQKWINKAVDYFAYPNGNYSMREIKVLQALGYKIAFTVRPAYLTPLQLQGRYELPRFEVIENAPFSETICRMMGVWEPMIHTIRSITASKTTNKARHTIISQEVAESYH